MTNEQLRMQMLSGIIAEGEYKAKLEENKKPKNKKSLKENFVGLAAINNPFPTRKKEKYEDAFEHFLSERYLTNFENREQDLEEDKDPDVYESEETDAAQVYEEEITENEPLKEDEFTIAMNVQAVINDLLNMEGGQEALKLLEQIDEWNELVDMATNM